MRKIPVAGPSITQVEIDLVNEAVRTAWYDGAGRYASKFERAFADYVDRAHAIALPSCTSAIHLALASLGIGPGDEVIVPDTTWIATSAPVRYVGADVVFADIDPVTWCISAESIRSVITPRTKAIIVVDLYGSVPDFDEIERIADEHGIAMIEDSAEAVGSLYKGRKAGHFGTFSTFSFHGSKTLTTGEGGMLLTSDQRLQARALFLRDHGRNAGDVLFENAEVAYKYKMSDLQAALGLAQLQRIDDLVGKKRKIFDWYNERIGGMNGIALNAEPPGTFNSYWMVTVVFDEMLGVTKKQVFDHLNAHGVSTRPFFSPLSSLAAYRGHPQSVDGAKARPNAYSIGGRAINLPSALSLDERDVDRVYETLRTLLKA